MKRREKMLTRKRVVTFRSHKRASTHRIHVLQEIKRNDEMRMQWKRTKPSNEKDKGEREKCVYVTEGRSRTLKEGS
jgi:hypothetical protein